jgi:hypothetical protein
LKPKLWERLAGAGVGFASGWGNAERGAQLGGDVTNRRYNTAMRDYTHQTGALDKQLEDERGGFPLAEAQAKLPQTAFENWMQVGKLGTEQQVAKANIQNKSDLNDVKQQMVHIAELRESDQKQAQNDRDKFTVGSDQKSLEAERKGRHTSIENYYKEHPILTMFSDKDKENKAVDDDINQRLGSVRAQMGASATPAPQSHVWSKSGWAKANPGKDAAAAERKATKQGFQVVPYSTRTYHVLTTS